MLQCFNFVLYRTKPCVELCQSLITLRAIHTSSRPNIKLTHRLCYVKEVIGQLLCNILWVNSLGGITFLRFLLFLADMLFESLDLLL